jgi:hypothetical protein
MTLNTYCQPIRSLPISTIDTEAVMKVLQPIWTKIPEAADKIMLWRCRKLLSPEENS